MFNKLTILLVNSNYPWESKKHPLLSTSLFSFSPPYYVLHLLTLQAALHYIQSSLAVYTLLPGMSSSKYDVKLKLTPDIPLNKKLRPITSSLWLCNMCAIYRPEMKWRPEISPQGASLLFRSKFVRCIDITK